MTRVQKFGDTAFHHKLNFEGDVEIIVKPSKVGHVPATHEVTEHYVVKVPFEDMKKLVLDGLRHKMIQNLTDATSKEIEEWILHNLR